MYIKNTRNTMERIDLKSCNLEFESTWGESKNQKSKNIIIGCMYRHPHHNNLEEFNLYMKNTLLKIAKEKKEVSVVTSILTYSNMKMIQLYKTFTT